LTFPGKGRNVTLDSGEAGKSTQLAACHQFRRNSFLQNKQVVCQARKTRATWKK
jgi:hypothetical protein